MLWPLNPLAASKQLTLAEILVLGRTLESSRPSVCCVSECNNFYEIAVPAPLFVTATRTLQQQPTLGFSFPLSTCHRQCQQLQRSTSTASQLIETLTRQSTQQVLDILVRSPSRAVRSFVWYSSSASSHHVFPSRMFAAISSVHHESIYTSILSRNPAQPLLIAARRSCVSECLSSPQPLTSSNSTEDDPPQEECQEGYPVLPDGLRSIWHWSVSSFPPASRLIPAPYARWPFCAQSI